MGDVAIDLQNVTKRFVLDTHRSTSLKEAFVRRGRTTSKDFWALNGVTLQVPRGSFFGLIGHNGSGKSTLLRLMGGIHRPTSGTVTTNGRISALLELGAGFHPDLTGRENIYLNGAMLGLSKQHMSESIDEIIDFSGIGDFVDAPVKIYSSGMHVRLGFAISVHVDPEILIVDEVLAVGDEDFQRKCLDHIYALRRRGVTIVLVSHGVAQMETLCDEIAWLDHGTLQMVGPGPDVVQRYLGMVNAQENERLAEAEAQAAAEAEAEQTAETSEDGPVGKVTIAASDAERRGSGEIRIHHVDFHDAAGNDLQSASAGDPFVFRLHYEAAQDIDDPVFGLAIFHENGTHVTGPNQKISEVGNGTVAPGTGYVDVSVDRMRLLPGKYYITTGIYSDDLMHCFDSWHRSHRLIVQPGSSIERHGMVELGATWTPAQPTKAV